MDNTKRIVATLGADDNEGKDYKEYVHNYEGFLKRVADAAKQAHEDNLKTRKKEFRDFINHKGGRGFA